MPFSDTDVHSLKKNPFEDLAKALTVANIDQLGTAGIAKLGSLKKSLQNHEVEYFKQNFRCNLKFILKTTESEAYFGLNQTSLMKHFDWVLNTPLGVTLH